MSDSAKVAPTIDRSAFEKCETCRAENKCRKQGWCDIREGLGELDRAHLDALQAKHPRSAITVTRRFFDGTEGKPFGSVPNDWDGSRVTYEFRMVAVYR